MLFYWIKWSLKTSLLCTLKVWIEIGNTKKQQERITQISKVSDKQISEPTPKPAQHTHTHTESSPQSTQEHRRHIYIPITWINILSPDCVKFFESWVGLENKCSFSRKRQWNIIQSKWVCMNEWRDRVAETKRRANRQTNGQNPHTHTYTRKSEIFRTKYAQLVFR